MQSSRWLCWKWSVPNWASQRRQRQGTKTPSVTEWRKNLGRNQAQSGGSSPPARQISSLFQLQQSQSVSGPLVPGVFPRWMSRWRGPHWRSVSGAHLCVLDSADGQGCRALQRLVLVKLSFLPLVLRSSLFYNLVFSYLVLISYAFRRKYFATYFKIIKILIYKYLVLSYNILWFYNKVFCCTF